MTTANSIKLQNFNKTIDRSLITMYIKVFREYLLMHLKLQLNSYFTRIIFFVSVKLPARNFTKYTPLGCDEAFHVTS